MCTSHTRRRKAGLPVEDASINTYGMLKCTESGCGEPHFAKGLCKSHYGKEAHKGLVAEGWDFADANLRWKYGITREVREEMILAQGGLCACCGEPDRNGRALHVDHDHSHCGGPRKGCPECVRGLVCAKCNHRLSVVENLEWMEKARAYLER